MRDADLTAWDTEYARGSEFIKAPPLACVSWARPDGASGLFHWTNDRLHVWLADVLSNRISVGLRIATDVTVCCIQFPDLFPLAFQAYAEGRILDVRLAQKLHDISEGEHESPRYMHNGQPYSLEAITWRHFRHQLNKDNPWRLEYGELRKFPLEAWPEGARTYAVEDARWSLKDFIAIRDKYGATAMGDLGRQTAHAFALHLVKCWGMRTDTELVQRIKRASEQEYARLRDDVLVPNGLVRVEYRSKRDPSRGFDYVKTAQAIKDRIIQASALTGIRPALTKTGKQKEKDGVPFDRLKYVATDAEACDDYSAALAGLGYTEQAAVLDAWSSFGSLGTRLTTQFPYLERGQLHLNFESLRETTRTACGGGDGLENEDGEKILRGGYNGQNQPTGDENGIVLGERECCVPRPGCVFGDNDYGGLELCTGAQMNLDLRGFSKMAEVLNSGKNAHTDFGAALVGLSYDDAKKRKADGDGPFLKTYDVAKRCNFGFGGGMGPTRFQATCKKGGTILTLDRCKELHKAWPARWTEFGIHFKWAKALTGSYDDPRPARVKFLRVERWRGGLHYGELCNTLFQALGADVAKDALFEVVRAMYDVTRGSVLFGSHVVNFIHDQILSEFPEQTAHECALEQTRIMNEVAARWLPGCPAKTAPTLARRFSKHAKELYDAGGCLVPWEHPTILLEQAGPLR